MIENIHTHFAKHILNKCGLPEEYAVWSKFADSDIYNYHRFTTHKISNFNSLYSFYIQKYDMRKMINEDIAYLMHISHLYLDTLNGPLKILDGINITSHNGLFKLFKKNGYVKTINKIYTNIHNPSGEYVNSMCSLIDSLDIDSKPAIFDVLINRIIEETIGKVNIKPLSNQEISNGCYTKHYQEFLRFEEKAFLYLEYL